MAHTARLMICNTHWERDSTSEPSGHLRRHYFKGDTLNPLKPSGYHTYHLLQHTKTLHSAHTVYLCVPYGSHNKQRLFPQTTLTGWAL
jgi:hypothetical protein